jgi:RNA methyltransferase, TrmH family
MTVDSPPPQLTQAQFNRCRSLKRKQKRLEERSFLVEGIKNIQELLQSDFKVEMLLHLSAVKPESLLHRTVDCPRFTVAPKYLKQLCETVTPEGILAVVALPENIPSYKTDQPALYLDGINDPGNLGTIIRTADWFGLTPLVLSHDTVDPFNGKVIRSSMGSMFHLPLLQDDSDNNILKQLKSEGRELIGLTLDATEQLHTADLPSAPLLVLGSESNGIRPEIDVQLDRTLRIPGAGRAESLNAAQAFTLAAYQLQIINRNQPGEPA